MPATLPNVTNEDIINIINGLPNIEITLGADDAALDAYVIAVDKEIVNRFGPHPNENEGDYAQRRLTLAEVVGIDMLGRGDARARRTRALSRVGVVMAGGYSADDDGDGDDGGGG